MRRTTRSGLPLIGEYDPCFEQRLPHPLLAPHGGRRRGLGERLRDVRIYEAMGRVAQYCDLEWDFRDGWIWLRSPRTVAAWAGQVDLSPPACKSGKKRTYRSAPGEKDSRQRRKHRKRPDGHG